MRSPGVKKIRRVYKPVIHLLALIPLGGLVWGFLNHTLGANPVETLTHVTGEWGLRFLFITLAVSPLARLTQSGWMVQFRRLLGLYAFFYVLLHFLIYLLLDLSFDFGFLFEDIVDRPYITVGFVAFVLLLLLAVTSPIKVRQRMGRNWDRLHRFIYLIGVLSIIHFLWITKADDLEPMVYGMIFAVLMGYRIAKKVKKRRPAANPSYSA